MLETLKQGLLITVIGMGIVFVMIILLWGIMALLVKITNNPDDEESAAESENAAVEAAPIAVAGDASALAAAIAVAYARSAVSKTAFVTDTQSIQTGSTWLAAGRAQQIAQQTNRGRSS